MKKIYIILLISLIGLISLKAKCQSDNKFNFRIENNTVLWQKVFDTRLTYNQIIEIISKDNKYSNIKQFDSTIVFTHEKLDPDLKGAGYSRGSAPMYILDNLIKQDVTIEVKQNRYRVTCKNIFCVQQRSIQIGFLSTTNGETHSIESIVINRKGELKKGITAYGYEILDYNYTKEFNFNNRIVKKDDNW